MRNSKQYIDSLVNKLLKETLEDKANEVMEKLNFKPGKSFDYVQEGEMCESCGGEMTEGECMECGYKSGEVMEKLYGRQKNIDKNRNGKIDDEDFKMIRRKKSEMSEEDEYSKMCESCGGDMREGETCEECGGDMGMGKNIKETVYRLVDGNNSELFTENEIIDIIENIVKEEKKKEDNITKGASHRGYSEYEKAHKGSGKENKQYLDSVAKKLTEYLKDGSKGKYDTNPKHFPKGNGQLAKMDKMAYEIDEEGTDFNMEIAGQNIPDYDGKPPKKEFIEKQIKGSSTNGNNQDWANADNTGVNDKFAKYFENDQLAKWKDESYGRVPSPVYDEITEKGKTKGKNKLKEEFDRMKGLIGYDRKTQ